MEQEKHKLVIKIGSSSITNKEVGLNYALINEIARQSSVLHAIGVEIAIVSSGAVAAGRFLLGDKDGSLTDKQIAASFGQCELTNAWIQAFKKYDILAAQFLLTGGDLEYPKQTLLGALKRGITVINANDTVNDVEMKHYEIAEDNDQLSGFVTKTINAGKLVLLTDVKGVLDSTGDVIRELGSISEIEKIHTVGKSAVGTGGMRSKLSVAWNMAEMNKKVWIAQAKEEDVLLKIYRGEQVGTKVYKRMNTVAERKVKAAESVRL